MPQTSDWNTVAYLLASKGAQPFKKPFPNVMVYYAENTGEYIKVTRTSGGYQYSVHRSRAECGC